VPCRHPEGDLVIDRRRRARARAVLLWLAVALAQIPLLGGPALGQERFRITYTVEQAAPGRARVVGQVVNEARTDVLDVWVTAEVLDRAGRVVARGLAFVSPHLREGAGAPFEALVPAFPSGASVRVRVSSFRFGLGRPESP
jgi:hypothetical protein